MLTINNSVKFFKFQFIQQGFISSTKMAKAEYTFRVGDGVWAKMKGFSAWPGKIEIPTDGMKRPAMKKVRVIA